MNWIVEFYDDNDFLFCRKLYTSKRDAEKYSQVISKKIRKITSKIRRGS